MSYFLLWLGVSILHVGESKMDFVGKVLHALSGHAVEGYNAWLLDWT